MMVIVTELTAGSSSSTTNSNYKYDVFLSFRGGDTRYSFTDHLHKALVDAAIETFLDYEQIEIGEDLKPELHRAISESRSAIIVLSKNYASSTWCLNELVSILDQRRSSGLVVLPIFYHVEPSDIRKLRNGFGEAMAKHEQRIEEETDDERKRQRNWKMKQWKEALMEVADLKAMVAQGRETMFIEDIVKEIAGRLDLHLRSINSNLIGMQCSIETISSWLKDRSSHTADILTIWGMGGIGKTSLAKYIYQKHYNEFERSSFLEDIERRFSEQSTGRLNLQKQLLKDIRKRGLIEVQNVEICTIMIEKSLYGHQMLLVLDGIDNFEQLDVLIGTKGFHPGSKIIITTRDGSLTEKCGVFSTNFQPKHIKHLLKGLDENEALRLLSWHAFRCNEPQEGYEEESEKVVAYCGGHPLALKVLGSSLRNEDVGAWEDTVELLVKEINPDIRKVLQISFDSLPFENDKELFKHIACFFVGKDRVFAEMILKECGIRTSFGFSKLIDRCLLSIGPENELVMHQLLQDMGRDVVRQEAPKKPWKRSRLWCHEESFNVLKEEKGTPKLQGLALDMKMLQKGKLGGSFNSKMQKLNDHFHENLRSSSFLQKFHGFFSRICWLFCWVFLFLSSFNREKFDLKTNAFSKMDNLKILQLNYVQLNGSYKSFPKGLRWLCMQGSLSKYVPSDLPMDNLVALDMSYSNLQRLWKKPKFLGCLKILNLSSCKLVGIDGFSGLPALEHLILARNASLMEVCESIGQCDRLVLLDLSDCSKLRKLPRSVGKLKNVKILSILGCKNLHKFPIEMNDMKSLQVLNANCISRISKSLSLSLPHSLVNLSLINNDLSNESFPMNFHGLPMLKELYIGMNPIKSLPDCVRNLSRLEILNVQGCDMLQSVLCPPRTITSLHVGFCSSLEKITFHPETSKPLDVRYLSSPSLIEIEGMIKFQPVAQIDRDIISRLCWTNFEFDKNHDLKVRYPFIWHGAKKLPLQMVYEYGIFSTVLRGKEVPTWIIDKSKGSSLTSIMPPSHSNLRGFNLCFVHTCGEILATLGCIQIKIINMTKKRTWTYIPYFYAAGKGEECLIWLSHWMFGKEELEDGDEVRVTIDDTRDAAEVMEVGITMVYEDEDEDKDDLLNYYKSWKHIIRGDLSSYQLKSGDYFLSNNPYFDAAYIEARLK